MTSFTSRQVPWMTIGQIVEEDVDVAQATKLGGLDFTVSLRDIQFNGTVNADADPFWTSAPSRKAVVRDDTGEFYDVVSADYGVLQYSEAFDFLKNVNPKIAAAGTLKNGRQGFMVVQLPDLPDVQMLFDDPHELYVVVRTSHDRTRAVEVSVMPLRERCMNQLGLPSFSIGAKQRWSVHHIGNVADKLHSAEEMITGAKAYHADFINTANRLYETVLDNDDASRILHHVIRKAPGQEEVIDRVLDMWHNRETVGFGGTGWGLVNAVSEYYEWDRPMGNRTAQSQFLGALEGTTSGALRRTTSMILSRR